ncbi:4'-phosphopantetheinyl transferase [Microbacterium sp. SORGH_AS 1204]|uniref:hypothetical protein n=1 Tax=Microbacterium sp. SORGH_AS_1204 TaxID=3041785 RepID=UPI0027928543|nr:hypothetical protein [Microbacterium sp. SORGH_AS_1204]MDQ1136171.1 4'-phosphopantetheinyl transferase [Microbacterium sp. SORGH_AS_1204]
MSPAAGIRIAWRAVPPGAPRRGASRALLAELLPGASFVSRCAACGGDHGRVRVEGVDAAVSVSYVPGWAVVAVTREHPRIGVDAVPAEAGGLERVLPGRSAERAWAGVEDVHIRVRGAANALDWARIEDAPARLHGVADALDWARVEDALARARSAADAREWARVEAVLKADGRGLRVDPSRVTVRATGDGWVARVTESNRHPSGAGRIEWRGWDLDGPAGVVLAVAVEAAVMVE